MSAAKFNEKYTNKEGFKTLLWICAAIAAIFFLGQIMKFLKKGMSLFTGSEEQKKIEEVQTNVVDDIRNEVKNASLPKPDSFYQAIAESQYEAMQYSGTNYSALKNSIKDLSGAELKKVFVLFGMRPNYTFGYAESLKNLFGWYLEELTSYSLFGKSQLDEIREIWAKSGLTF